MIQWFTRSSNEFAFSTCYFFNEDTTELVRITLELNSPEDGPDGGPRISYLSECMIGFTSETLLGHDGFDLYETEDGYHFMSYDDTVLEAFPASGLNGYYYLYGEDGRPLNGVVYRCGRVIEKPNLPSRINEYHLETVAEYCMKVRGSTVMVKKNATENQLVEAIKAIVDIPRQIARGKGKLHPF